MNRRIQMMISSKPFMKVLKDSFTKKLFYDLVSVYNFWYTNYIAYDIHKVPACHQQLEF